MPTGNVYGSTELSEILHLYLVIRHKYRELQKFSLVQACLKQPKYWPSALKVSKLSAETVCVLLLSN